MMYRGMEKLDETVTGLCAIFFIYFFLLLFSRKYIIESSQLICVVFSSHKPGTPEK